MIQRFQSVLLLTALLIVPQFGTVQAEERNSTSSSSVRKFLSGWTQNITTSMVFLKLDTPALLETAVFDEDNNLVIDQDQLALILDEQERLKSELLALSPKIRVLFSYRFVMNGLTIVAPSELYATILEMRPVKSLSEPVYFERPAPLSVEGLNAAIEKSRERVTTTDFIGATQVHNDYDLRGQGIHVGIIDSGVDYTHAMFGGPGTREAYQSVNPLEETPLFPNEKVVGGFDFVGDVYNPGSILSDIRIPRPDANPIDTSGHGTHVAGTVAGVGYDEASFDGVAPDAKLHALKVFGPRGGTSDLVVMAAMEYAVDPSGNFDPSDRLDVINMSLGGMFGKPTNNYQEAVNNLGRAGIVVTASAGNSGAIPYVVGSPSTSDLAFSVGASVDGMFHNWRFDAVEFNFADGSDQLIEAVEGTISRPVADAEGVEGKIVFAGLGNEPLADDVAARVRGNIAMMERGGEPFTTKFQNAINAGAIGILMANNQPGDPIPMGGDNSFDVPGVMISQELAQTIIAKLNTGEEVRLNFAPGRYIQQPELVDTLASFSSQGPRSEDSRLKPEIVAPGFQIFSARAGSGDEVVPMNGTSMSAPQMAGVMALMRQAYPLKSVEELQTIVMNTAKNMNDAEGTPYVLSRQGAGRVQVYEAITAPMIVSPRAFSLGEQRLGAPNAPTVIEDKIVIKELLTDRARSLGDYRLEVENARNMQVVFPESVTGTGLDEVPVRFILTQEHVVEGQTIINHEAVIRVVDAATDRVLARIPALAVGLRSSNVQSELNGGRLTLSNFSVYPGAAWPFNLLARGERHPDLGRDGASVSTACNLMTTGYRITPGTLEEGPARLEFGFEIDRPVSRWEACTLIVLFSVEGGEGSHTEADLELVGSSAYRISDLGDHEITTLYNSLLFDAPQSRKLRADFEQLILDRGNDQGVPRPDYSVALIDHQPMNVREHGRAATVSVYYQPLLNALKKKGLQGKEVYYKIGILNNTNAALQYDSFLSEGWERLSLEIEDQAFKNLPRELNLRGGTRGSIELTPTTNNRGELLILAPDNL